MLYPNRMQIVPASISETYKQGHLNVTYERICEVLGQPNFDDDYDKVRYSWRYSVDGSPVAIWDYKGVRWSYYGSREMMVKLFGEEAVQ